MVLAQSQWTPMDQLQFLILVVCLAIGLLATLFGRLFTLYLQARVSGARIPFIELVGMRLRKTDVRLVVYSRIRAVKAGLDISTAKLETHALAGGRVANVVAAMIAAKGAGLKLDWSTAVKADFEGKDVLALVQKRIQSRGRTSALDP
jgi:uncharacterized protein YqfA (UPF0365 family)